jgi:hypothetical protein
MTKYEKAGKDEEGAYFVGTVVVTVSALIIKM